jgi:hypothetical protein
MSQPLALRVRQASTRAAAFGLALTTLILTPATPTLACGGLFCDSSQVPGPQFGGLSSPVVQAGESILFAHHEGTMHMLVRLSYEGPPIGFGWLLPVPPDVSSRTASPNLFSILELRFRPTFTVESVFEEGCEPPPPVYDDYGYGGGGGAGGAGGEGGAGGDGGGTVQVISREIVGPYDQVVLRAERADEVTQWLNDNAFQAPADAEARLQPYLDVGAAILALKLVASATDKDVVPIHLTFTGDTASIPLRPTAVAAQPDMGIAAHFLGTSRAVPLNYRHVTIDETAIDWRRSGRNYVDVVSAAVDEAGGRAFVTDHADNYISQLLAVRVPPDSVLSEAQEAQTLGDLVNGRLNLTDPDIGRLVTQFFTPPEGISATQYLRCLGCYDDWTERPFDGAAFVEALERDVFASQRLLAEPIAANPYLTRLFTTMSPEEMTEDPIFGFNPDLETVASWHRATRHIGCTYPHEPDYQNTTVVTPNGQWLIEGTGARTPIERQDGRTVRGGNAPAALTIERMLAAGQPELEVDHRPGLIPPTLPGGPTEPERRHEDDADGGADRQTSGPTGGYGGKTGCACNLADGPLPVAPTVLLLGLLGITRRRRA